MRVFGDLNGPEKPTAHDPLGSGADGERRNLNPENSPRAIGEDSNLNDRRDVRPSQPTASGGQEPAHDPKRDFVGGMLPPEPTPHLLKDSRPGKRPVDRIGEQRLNPAGDTNYPAHLYSRRTSAGAWFVLIIMILAMLGAGVYGYLNLRNNHIALSQVPAALRSLATMGGRMDAAEAKLNGLADKWDALTDHLAELDRKFDAGQHATRSQMRELVGQAASHLQAELDQRSEAVDTRLNNMESRQTQDRAQLEQLNDQLRNQVASLREQLNAVQEGTGRDLANMQGQVSNDTGNLRTLAQSLHRERMSFELVKNSPTELAPGVTLTVLKTDPDYQRFKGYVFMTNEAKTLWLNNLSANESVDLYSQRYTHPYSLVVTTVNNDGVVGYLLLPAGA